MGFFDRFFNRPPSREQFAQLILKRIRRAGDTRPVTYDAAAFRIVQSNNYVAFLGNLYEEYLRAEKSEREEIVRRFLTMWFTSELELPDEFDDAKADLLPALRARSYFEIDVQLAAEKESPPPPYQTIGEHLALSLVYDLPTSMRTINEEVLEKWGISFYEAMEVAKQNLAEKPMQIAQVGTGYALTNGDGYDATRMILLDQFGEIEVKGDLIAMIPNRERLYFAGSDDLDGLQFLLHFAEQDVQHERFISGMAFKRDPDHWSPWLPEPDHSLHDRFRNLWLQTMGQMYESQTALLNRRHEQEGIDIFVATFSGLSEKDTGRSFSYSMWADGIDTLLPETDQVFLVRPEGDSVTTCARGSWGAVRRAAGELMEPQSLYPERWRVRTFPSAETLSQIGDGEAVR